MPFVFLWRPDLKFAVCSVSGESNSNNSAHGGAEVRGLGAVSQEKSEHLFLQMCFACLSLDDKVSF